MGSVVKVPSGLPAEDRRSLVPEPCPAPDVTVVVPCYNVADYVEQCIASIFDNRFVRLEVLAVNDGSTDDTPRILDRLAREHGGLTVLDKANGGYGAACNLAIDCAHGAYVAIVEPDDYVLPGFYDEAFAFAGSFEEPPQVVKTPYIRVCMAGTPRERHYQCLYRGRVRPDHQPFALADAPRLIQYHPSIWSALYLRSFLDDDHIRFLEAPGAGWVDNPFLVETLARATSIAYLDKPFYCYREDLPGSSSARMRPDLVSERWGQMTDVLEGLGVTDRGVWWAHYVRGFNNLTRSLDDARLSGAEAEAMLRAMFVRMDPDLVFSDPYLSNGWKELFCRVMDIEGATWDRSAHLGSLAGDLFNGLLVNGPSFALSQIHLFLDRHQRRAAGGADKAPSQAQ